MTTADPPPQARILRAAYHQELSLLDDGLVRLSHLAGEALARASTALLDADLSLAERVISDDTAIDTLHRDIDDQVLVMLACQQPVATDLRTIVAALRMSADLERMGDLARHVAETARRRHPGHAVPPRLRDTVAAMAEAAARMVTRTATVIAEHDAAAAVELARDDERMDRLQDKLYQDLLDDPDHGDDSRTTMDITLIGRYYERYADHAVAVARRVAFLAGASGLDAQDRTLHPLASDQR